MKKRVISLVVLMCLMGAICMPVSAVSSNQDDEAVIATDEFVVYVTDRSKSVSVYPVNVRTDILYLEDKGLGFRIYAITAIPIIDELSGFVEYNTSLDADHGIVVRYSESNDFPSTGIEWIEYTGNKYDSGVKITASFSGTVGAETEYLGEEVLLDGYFSRTVEATIP